MSNFDLLRPQSLLLQNAFVEAYTTGHSEVLFAKWLKLTAEPAFYQAQEAFMGLFAENSFVALVDDMRECVDVDPRVLADLEDVIAPMMQQVGLRYTAILVNEAQSLQTNQDDIQVNVSMNIIMEFFQDPGEAEQWLTEMLNW